MMRILHTADWHFGKTLEGRDRIPEQQAFVDELCNLCKDEEIDLVLMAGDVFQTVNPSAQAEELFYETLDRLAAGGTRGIVAIAGNHDSPDRLAAVSPLADRLGITLIGLPKDPLAAQAQPPAGARRVWRKAAGPSWLELGVPGCNETAVIAALPYPSEARLKELLSVSLDEAEFSQNYNERIREIFSLLARNYRADTVNLAISHLFVQGGLESDSEIQIQVGGTYAVDPTVFPASAQYVGLGHLHRPQIVAGAPVPTRYAGSPLAYSFSEVGYTKSVVIIDALPGKDADIREVYLSSGKPLVKWVAKGGLPEVIRWVDEGKDAQAWIDLELHLDDGLTIADAHMLRSIHPGFVNIRPVFTTLGDAGQAGLQVSQLPVDEMFIRFFERQKGFQPDERLVQAFLELLGDGQDADASEPSRAEEVAG